MHLCPDEFYALLLMAENLPFLGRYIVACFPRRIK